jgi:hypothetical protein
VCGRSRLSGGKGTRTLVCVVWQGYCTVKNILVPLTRCPKRARLGRGMFLVLYEMFKSNYIHKACNVLFFYFIYKVQCNDKKLDEGSLQWKYRLSVLHMRSRVTSGPCRCVTGSLLWNETLLVLHIRYEVTLYTKCEKDSLLWKQTFLILYARSRVTVSLYFMCDIGNLLWKETMFWYAKGETNSISKSTTIIASYIKI